MDLSDKPTKLESVESKENFVIDFLKKFYQLVCVYASSCWNKEKNKKEEEEKKKEEEEKKKKEEERKKREEERKKREEERKKREEERKKREEEKRKKIINLFKKCFFKKSILESEIIKDLLGSYKEGFLDDILSNTHEAFEVLVQELSCLNKQEPSRNLDNIQKQDEIERQKLSERVFIVKNLKKEIEKGILMRKIIIKMRNEFWLNDEGKKFFDKGENEGRFIPKIRKIFLNVLRRFQEKDLNEILSNKSGKLKTLCKKLVFLDEEKANSFFNDNMELTREGQLRCEVIKRDFKNNTIDIQL